MMDQDPQTLHKLTSDVTKVLLPSEIDALRDSYDPEQLSNLATRALVEKFPASGLWVHTIQKILFKDDDNGGKPLLDLPARERELCLITLMSAQHLGMELGVHIYWGIMEGLEPREIAALMTLVGVYAGLSRFEAALSVMMKAVQAMHEAAECNQTDVLGVINQMLTAFGASPLEPSPKVAC